MNKQYFTDEFKIEAVKQITELGYSTSEVASRFTVLVLKQTPPQAVTYRILIVIHQLRFVLVPSGSALLQVFASQLPAQGRHIQAKHNSD